MGTSPGGVEVGRVSLRVVPDTSRLGPDLKVALDRVEAQTDLKISTSIDTARLDAQARAAVEQAQLAAGDIDIKTNVDTSQVRGAESAINGASAAATGFTSGLGAMATAAIVLGPALIPIIATLAALGSALVAPLAIAGGGATLFAVLTGAVVKQTEEQKKKIDQLKASVDAAKLSLTNTQASASASASASIASAKASAQASLTSARTALAQATTAAGKASALARIHAAEVSLQNRKTAIATSQNNSVAAAQLRVNEATTAYQAALAELTPAQSKFLAAQAGFKDAFHKLIVDVGPALLGPVTQVIKLVTSLLPSIRPVLTAVSSVVSEVIQQFGFLAKSPGYKSFIQSFASLVGDDIRDFAAMAGNVFHGLFGLFAAFNAQLSGDVLSSIVLLTRKFSIWGQEVGQSKGFRSFVDYIKRVGPQVAHALAGIAAGAVAIVVAFAPIGTTVLTIVGNLAGAIAKIPADTLATLATALVAVVAASKLIGPLSFAFEALTSPVGLAVVAAVALGAGFVLLYQQSKPLRNVLNDLGDFFKTQLLPIIKQAAEQVLPALKGAFSDISKAIKDNKPFIELMGKLFLTLASAVVVTGIIAVVLAIKAMGKYVALAIPFWKLLVKAVVGFVQTAVAAFTLFARAVLGAFGVIVDAAVGAFGWIPGIGGKLRGAQAAFHSFADGAIAGLQRTSDRLKALQDQIDGIHDKSFKVNIANNNALVRQLQALQDFRLHDKSFKITANAVERQVGPGGGIGLPAGTGGTTPAPSTRGGDTYNIQAHDYNDFLQQQQRRKRGKSGGGVNLGGVR